MDKKLWVVFAITVIVLVSIALVAMLIFLPQSTPISAELNENYEGVDKTQYEFAGEKDVSEMIEEYDVTNQEITEGKADKNYLQGNTDPFTPQSQRPASNTDTGNNKNVDIYGNNTGPASADDK